MLPSDHITDRDYCERQQPVKTRRVRTHNQLALFSLLATATIAFPAPRAAAQTLGWNYQPYRIHTLVALDLPGGVAQQMTDVLPTYLQRRVNASIGNLWSFNVELTGGVMRQRILSQISTLPDKPPTDFPVEDVDKLVLIAVRWHPEGYSLTAREYDNFVRRWSMPIHRTTRQDEALPEQVFAILFRAVAPLAQFELNANDEKHILLKPRGAALMRPNSGEPWTKPGEVFVPILRRTMRGGQLIENGIHIVPWTFVQVVEGDAGRGGPSGGWYPAHFAPQTPQNEPVPTPQTAAQIFSGTRRPFGIRRQGRVEQVAIAVRSDPVDTVLSLHSRTTADKPLVGYEVFSQEDLKKPGSLARIGSTDREGRLEIPPGKSPVRLIFVKNGVHLLARLPIVPGAQPEISVPLPDDDARLAAETRLAALREDLIDVVARRNILMARVRQRIKKKDFAGAQKLIGEINELPGRSQFNLELTTAARRTRSDDPQIQRRIDQLFEGTQAALSQYLDVRPISELSDELRAAQQKGT